MSSSSCSRAARSAGTQPGASVESAAASGGGDTGAPATTGVGAGGGAGRLGRDAGCRHAISIRSVASRLMDRRYALTATPGYSAAMATAVIDIGTNTLLLLIVDDRMKPLVDLCRFGRLGKGLDASGRLAVESIAASLDICREYRQVMEDAGVTAPIVVGTQALREAANSQDFVAPAQAILGAPIEVIAGEREAQLAFISVARTFPELAQAPYVVVDVGGGSTEIIVSNGTKVVSAVSLPIGAVRLTERHLKHDPPTSDETRALFADIDGRLAQLELPAAVPVVATAGTATTLAAMALRLDRYDAVAVTGLRLEAMAVDAQLARLLTATTAARRAIRGMEPQRADVIAGGVAILARVMHRIDAPVMITCDRGVRWGLAYENAAG